MVSFSHLKPIIKPNQPRSLATCDNYYLTGKNASYHLMILQGHLWGGGFQMSGVGQRQIAGGNGRNPSGPEGWIWEVFGPVITVGSSRYT